MNRRSLVAAGAAAVAAAVATAASLVVADNSRDRREATHPCALERVRTPGVSRLADVVGVASNFVWDEGADVEGELVMLAACGVRAVREDVLWEVVEPEPGTFDWRRTDRVMLAAARAGVGVLGILGYSAPWSSTDPSGGGDRSYPPRADGEFARYAAAVAARYAASSPFWDDRAPAGFRPLLGLEIWNEAWGWWAWRPAPDPTRYASLARAAASAIEHAAPNVPVVLTADPFQIRRDGGDDRWFEAVLDADPTLPDLVDVYAVHPYPQPRETGPLVARADPRTAVGRVAIVDDLARERGVRRPVWITEIGWSTSAVPGGVSESQQARNVIDIIEHATNEWPFVERVFVYTWARDRTQATDLESGFGLRRADASPKPALGALIRLLAEADAR